MNKLENPTNEVESAFERALKFYQADPSHPEILAAEAAVRLRPEYREHMETYALSEGTPEAARVLKLLALAYLAGQLSAKPIN